MSDNVLNEDGDFADPELLNDLNAKRDQGLLLGAEGTQVEQDLTWEMMNKIKVI